MEMRIFVVALVGVLQISPLVNAEWNDPLGQYHIQTDEGPERYFRYQTQSGQYRKEKRLEDGTVIGTYAWIDANGYLRQRDYIADDAGYRILKTKNVLVGTHTPIEQAIKAAKKAPAEAGILVHNVPKTQTPIRTYVPSVTTTTEPPVRTYVPSVPSTTESPFRTYIPSLSVQITPNANPYEGYSSLPSHVSNLITSTERPDGGTITQNTQAPIYIPSTPLPPISNTYSSDIPNTILPTLAPPLDSNAVDYNGYSSNPQYEHYQKSYDNYQNPYIHQNGPTYPIDKYGHTFNGQSNKIGNGYDPQYPEYDGVSVTNDGFRYYIPRAYHEEQTLPGDRRSGSFGYVDPFGIRRVIYYNASPEGGFQHRKNNRYVGLNATPYDPRPY